MRLGEGESSVGGDRKQIGRQVGKESWGKEGGERIVGKG